MKILMISWEYPPQIDGGLGRHVAELAPALIQQGVELHIITPVATLFSTEAEQHTIDNLPCSAKTTLSAKISKEDGIIVHRVLAPKDDMTLDIYGRALKVNQILEFYINQIEPQHGPWHIIHIHDWLTGFAGMALSQAKNYPLLTTIHATERGRWHGYLNNQLQHSIDQTEQAIVNQSDQVLVCSQHMFKELQDFFQVAESKLNIVPNGVDISTLNNNHHNQDLHAFRAKYAAPYQQIVFTVSRLVHEKGIHRLVQAIPRILNTCPSAHVIIAGKGPEANHLKQLAQDLGVSQHVNFVGFISDEERNLLFKVADCAMFPSLYEPFGIVALEAMALGCPVVVSDVGGFFEVVAHTETGITTYADNYESVAWGISQALNHQDLAQKYATQARQTVEQKFTWPRIAAQTIKVYQKAIETHQTDA